MEDKDRFIDELLDASLRQYRSDEPRAGLENRILASVRASEFATQPRRSVWALAAGVAILVIAVVSLRFVSRPVPRTATVPSAPLTAAKTETPKAISTAPCALQKPIRRHQTTAVAQRRPEQFPTPSPLTEQEKLLLQYVNATPSPVLAVGSDQLRRRQDLVIVALTIAPVEPIRPISEPREDSKN